MIDVYYICNKEKSCSVHSNCKENFLCNHTSDMHFAKDDEAVRIFEAFIKDVDISIFEEFVRRFDINMDEDAHIYVTEKGEYSGPIIL